VFRGDREAGRQGVCCPPHHAGDVEEDTPGEEEVGREGLDPQVVPMPSGREVAAPRPRPRGASGAADVPDRVDRRGPCWPEVETSTSRDLAPGTVPDLVRLAVSRVERERVRRVERQDRGARVPDEAQVEDAGGADAAMNASTLTVSAAPAAAKFGGRR
jgi:hypothetical protein